MRGEYLVSGSQSGERLGSPPLAWGIHCIHKGQDCRGRITPTCVGNTAIVYPESAPEEDHPHLRGEYCCVHRSNCFFNGSPPLAWGIRKEFVDSYNWTRITPTCVGNTRPRERLPHNDEDHPHLRGEYKTGWLPKCSRQGSPPLAWGIPKINAKIASIMRITPTCVGNTSRHPEQTDAVWDHPHLRGEYIAR